MSVLLFRADAGAAIGTGHVMRSFALAQAWVEQGGSAAFLTALAVPALEDRLRNEGVSVGHLRSEPGSEADADETVDAARKLAAAWIVVDGYHFELSYQRRIKDSGMALACIDDGVCGSEFAADLVLNQNISADTISYRSSNSRLLLGTRYALLRREFWKWRDLHREIPAMARNVLITLGGSDPDNVTSTLLDALLGVNLAGLRIRVIVGVVNPHWSSLQKAAGASPSRIELISNTNDMPGLMAWADLAIAAGGSTCWELALMGLPVALVVLADNQRDIVAGMERKGAAINLGDHRSLERDAAARSLDSLIRDSSQRRAMSQAGRSLVDGLGASRVATILKEET